ENNLQPKWKRHVTIVRQTKNLHAADFTEIYDFLKMNQEENQQGFNAWHNGGIQCAQNAGVQSGGNQNGLVVVPGIVNQSGTDGSAEVHLNDNCYDNKIFNMFTQKEQYTDLLEPIPEPQLVP
nr:hypothetical protein [Tanacetum cinerariifolium]